MRVKRGGVVLMDEEMWTLSEGVGVFLHLYTCLCLGLYLDVEEGPLRRSGSPCFFSQTHASRAHLCNRVASRVHALSEHHTEVTTNVMRNFLMLWCHGCRVFHGYQRKYTPVSIQISTHSPLYPSSVRVHTTASFDVSQDLILFGDRWGIRRSTCHESMASLTCLTVP